MSLQIIQNRLDFYRCTSEIEEEHALREITQEVILAALGRTDFFSRAQFQGGTCLRIFFGLNRFSEDLDFILNSRNQTFDMTPYLGVLAKELKAYGYEPQIVDKTSSDAIVQKAFLKDDSLGKVLQLHYPRFDGSRKMIRIKLEVDTNPPEGSVSERRYIDFPFVSSVAIQDMPSLFAGKMHALLCRPYMKGRDWYDFIFYTSMRTPINYDFLSSALDQSGPWKQQSIQVNREWLVTQVRERITSMHWQEQADDVRRFIKAHEQDVLKFWSADLFLHQLSKL